MSISALANETLCEIFQHLCNSLTVAEWYTDTLPSLRLVSPGWNGVIENFPALWTSILITEESAKHSGESAPFMTTKIRLLRSRELRLNIYIFLQISPEDDSFDKSDGILLGEIIRGVAPRVACIKLHGNFESYMIQMAILSHLSGVPMPLLHSFAHIDPDPTCHLDRDHYFDNPSSILQYQGQPNTKKTLAEWGRELYPSLTDLELVGPVYNFDHLPIMSGIRRLRIGEQWHNTPSMKQLLEILRPARDTLEELYMEEYAMEIEEDASKSPLREPIIFKNLKVLSLKYSIPDTEHLFLESVRLPALVDLTLTCTAGLGDEHYDLEIYFSLIHHFPLQQIERLTLIETMFPLDDRLEVVSMHLGDDETQGMHWYCSEAPTLRGIAPICGNRTTPFFMFFLHQFASLRHLHMRDAVGLKEMMSPRWKWGVSSTLETLHLDGCPEWLLELMQSVEDDCRKSESRLQVSIGESLKSALSEEEKEKLERHIKTLSEL